MLQVACLHRPKDELRKETTSCCRDSQALNQFEKWMDYKSFRIKNPSKSEIKTNDLGIPPWIGNLRCWLKPNLQG